MDVIDGVVALRWRPVFRRRALLESAPLILLCLLPIVLYLPALDNPFERDEGTYATIAQGLLDGKVPYRDLFDNKPPLVYGWYAFSFLLFGESVVAPRLIAAVLLSATTLAVFSQARMALPRGASYGAAAIFALATGLPFVALHANTEAYMLLPLVTSLTTFTLGMRTGRLRWFLMAGALGGIAVMTKQVAVWNLAALLAMAVVWRWRSVEPLWRREAPFFVLLAGAGAALALVGTPFFATGALDDLVYANVSYNWLYVHFLTLGERLLDLTAGVGFVFALAAPLITAATAGAVMLLRGRARFLYFLLLAWAIGSMVGVATGGRFFPHYFLHLIPALALLSAVAIHEIGARVRARPLLLVGVSVSILSLVVNGALYVAPWRTEQRVAPNVFEQKRWEESSRELGAYIGQRTEPDDTIFNLGREPQIYFYADRRPAVQYFYDWAYQYD